MWGPAPHELDKPLGERHAGRGGRARREGVAEGEALAGRERAGRGKLGPPTSPARHLAASERADGVPHFPPTIKQLNDAMEPARYPLPLVGVSIGMERGCQQISGSPA